jgi:uncharacterized protein YciI
MSYYAVTREAGPGWLGGKSAFDQPGASEHAAFMNSLAEDGVVLFAGPLAGSEQGRIRVLLIAKAESEDEIHQRLADDPWAKTDRIVTVNAEPWSLLVGTERLPA